MYDGVLIVVASYSVGTRSTPVGIIVRQVWLSKHGGSVFANSCIRQLEKFRVDLLPGFRRLTMSPWRSTITFLSHDLRMTQCRGTGRKIGIMRQKLHAAVPVDCSSHPWSSLAVNELIYAWSLSPWISILYNQTATSISAKGRFDASIQ